jgi:hypothetical protein
MSRAEWGYLLLTSFFVFWWFATRLDRLGRQSEYETFLIRQEMAELLDNEERADELREKNDGDAQERKKARQQETIGFGVLGAGALAWWWFTVGQH